MAKKPTATIALNIAALSAIVAAGETGTFAPLAEVKLLAENGFIEINESVTDATGNVAVRATAAGLAKINEGSGAAPASAPVSTGFAISAVPADILSAAAEKRRAGRSGGEKYPFEGLEVGQGFFVAASEKMPEPAKSLASTVSSAVARYAEETGEVETVTVKDYAVGEDGKRLKDDEGHWVVTAEREEQRPKMRPTRVFKLVPVDAKEGQPAGAWVVRTA